MSVRDDTLDACKLTRTEFAVVRAYAQGMAAVDIANRYLLDPDEEEALSEHQAVQRILRLRDRLVQFALQNNRPDIAQMFDSLKGRSNVAMDRRVDALSSLERLAPGRPALDHAVSLWFGPSLSRRLTAAGIARIGDLVGRVNRRGAAWWRGVPRLGAKSADVVRHWLDRQRDTLRTDDGAPMLSPQIDALLSPGQRPPMRPASMDDQMPHPVPWEYMLFESQCGGWRALLAEDAALVEQWLDTKRPGSHTWASYRREAERLLLWTARRRRPLRAFTADDLTAYWAFLADPQPADFWQGPAGPRDRMPWRPFEGGLGDSSRLAAMRVIRSLFGWLLDRGVLTRHPCMGLSLPAPSNAGAGQAGRELAGGDGNVAIHAFRRWLDTADGSSNWRTANAAAYLIGDCGMRVGEVVETTVADLRLRGDTRWLLRSKPKKDGSGVAQSEVDREFHPVPLSEAAWAALTRHWSDRQLVVEALPETAPLLGPLMLPPTSRARAKHAGRLHAGYSASGLDRLLRAAWRDFIACPQHASFRMVRFTPRMLVRAQGAADVLDP